MSKLHIVAEIGGNHGGSKAEALHLITAAVEAGATAVKFQAFDPEDLSPDSETVPYRLMGGPWSGRYLHDLYRETYTPWEWLPELFHRVRNLGMEPFASVFNPCKVQRLIDMGARWIKIASPEVSYRGLVSAIASTKHPVILSDGAATVDQMVWALKRLSRSNVTVLRCVSQYPATAGSYGFGDIRNSDRPWGVSDHSRTSGIPAAAVAMGATMVEAHLMLGTGGRPLVDAGHSLTPYEFSLMADRCGEAHTLRQHHPTQHTRVSNTHGFRRRLAYATDMEAGTVLRQEHVECVRSSQGVEPDFPVVGNTLSQSRKQHAPIQREDLI